MICWLVLNMPEQDYQKNQNEFTTNLIISRQRYFSKKLEKLVNKTVVSVTGLPAHFLNKVRLLT